MPPFHSELSRRAFLGASAAAGAAALLPARAFAASPTAWPHLDKLANDYVTSGKLPGMVAYVRAGLREGLVAKGVATLGQPDPVGLDSLYRAYSMTKPITGMAAMMLIDEGRMGLDQPLADVLPAYAKMQVQVTPDGSITDLRPARTQITMRHLLTHTAGLGYNIIQKGPLKQAYFDNGLVPAEVSHLNLPDLPAPKPLPSLAAFADGLAKMPLVYEPGTVWSYSVSLDLMGRVIEVVSGMPFDRFVAQRIFEPCGMASSGFQVKPDLRGRLTTNYAVVKGALFPIDPAASSVYLDPPAYPFGGAGLVTSPRDYDRFLRMLLGYGVIENRRVMSERAVRIGTSDLLPGGVDRSRIYGPVSGFGAGGRVGLGEDTGTFGWSGAAGTVGFLNFRAKLSAGLWVQYMPPGALPLQDEFPRAVRADLFGEKVSAGKVAA